MLDINYSMFTEKKSVSTKVEGEKILCFASKIKGKFVSFYCRKSFLTGYTVPSKEMRKSEITRICKASSNDRIPKELLDVALDTGKEIWWRIKPHYWSTNHNDLFVGIYEWNSKKSRGYLITKGNPADKTIPPNPTKKGTKKKITKPQTKPTSFTNQRHRRKNKIKEERKTMATCGDIQSYINEFKEKVKSILSKYIECKFKPRTIDGYFPVSKDRMYLEDYDVEVDSDVEEESDYEDDEPVVQLVQQEKKQKVQQPHQKKQLKVQSHQLNPLKKVGKQIAKKTAAQRKIEKQIKEQKKVEEERNQQQLFAFGFSGPTKKPLPKSKQPKNKPKQNTPKQNKSKRTKIQKLQKIQFHRI